VRKKKSGEKSPRCGESPRAKVKVKRKLKGGLEPVNDKRVSEEEDCEHDKKEPIRNREGKKFEWDDRGKQKLLKKLSQTNTPCREKRGDAIGRTKQ